MCLYCIRTHVKELANESSESFLYIVEVYSTTDYQYLQMIKIYNLNKQYIISEPEILHKKKFYRFVIWSNIYTICYIWTWCLRHSIQYNTVILGNKLLCSDKAIHFTFNTCIHYLSSSSFQPIETMVIRNYINKNLSSHVQ